jgi:hypothetical protein
METAPLKSFAMWARRALIVEVNARVAAVLAPGSKDRIESAGSVASLERDIATAGGGQAGRETVVDKVAYTWFNRIIALRFMDANGYTGIGVVSPARGQTIGQIEVLADAKRGNIDPEVVTNKRTIETITALLDGTRRSDDAQGEAYAILLAEYCRHWNRSMPFMFEREGDYTELLIPANLLADDSVLARSATVLTEEVCQDVEVIGWLYQFYISERKDEVFAGFKKNKKAGAAEIPAATQLFTPHWIVRYLVENSLGRLWLLNRPTSRLAEHMDYYIAPVDDETDFLKVASPEELKIIDPAVGSGHMLSYAFDLLYEIYEECGYGPAEIPGLILLNNLYGTEIDARAGALAAFALAMKARARQRTFFSRKVSPNICVLVPIHFDPAELDFLWTLTARSDVPRADADDFWSTFEHADTFGSLTQSRGDVMVLLKTRLEDYPGLDADLFTAEILMKAAHVIEQAVYLSQRYSVVVANPPYMGNANMDSHLADFAKRWFPSSKMDLFSMFIERALSFIVPLGRIGMITMQSWMFLKTYQSLRESLLRDGTIVTMAHLGVGAFDSIGGEVVSTTAFVASGQSLPGYRGHYIKLTETRGEAAKDNALRQSISSEGDIYYATSQDLMAVPGSPLAYWLSPAIRAAFHAGSRLETEADVKHGLSTGKNAAVVRFWYEVSFDEVGLGLESVSAAHESGKKWFPYNKGGRFRRWFGNVEHVLRYDRFGVDLMATFPGHRHDGRSHYFLPGVTWSKVSGGLPAFRYQPRGQVFDVAGNSFFPHARSDVWGMLAFANSPIATQILAAIAPTINFEAGNIAGLPIVKDGYERVSERAQALVAIARRDWNSQETSFEFDQLRLIADSRGGTRLRDVVRRLIEEGKATTREVQELNEEVNLTLIKSYGLADEIEARVPVDQVSLFGNAVFRYGRSESDPDGRLTTDLVLDLVSFAVGAMFGRYSLDASGLVLANQGSTFQDFLASIPSPSFTPDEDNVIPLVDGDWFEDDIVARFREFLRAAFGDENFEENLRFVTESLGVKDLRDYFVKSFYKDHVQRYKKRPIYWLFSSPKGSFNALIYMHRYTPSTVSTVLNEYLREFKAKLEASRQHHERLAAGAGLPREKAAAEKEVDRLRKVLLELDEYEHGVLYPLATQQIVIHLDDGVKVNYPKFGAALKAIPGLEASDESRFHFSISAPQEEI